jgi:hypothetical protein
MVKKRLKNDTIFVYCINNTKKEKLKADLSKHTATHVGDSESSTTRNDSEKVVKNVIKEYLSQPADIFSSALQNSAFTKENVLYCFTFSSNKVKVPSPPPKIS